MNQVLASSDETKWRQAREQPVISLRTRRSRLFAARWGRVLSIHKMFFFFKIAFFATEMSIWIRLIVHPPLSGFQSWAVKWRRIYWAAGALLWFRALISRSLALMLAAPRPQIGSRPRCDLSVQPSELPLRRVAPLELLETKRATGGDEVTASRWDTSAPSLLLLQTTVNSTWTRVGLH